MRGPPLPPSINFALGDWEIETKRGMKIMRAAVKTAICASYKDAYDEGFSKGTEAERVRHRPHEDREAVFTFLKLNPRHWTAKQIAERVCTDPEICDRALKALLAIKKVQKSTEGYYVP